MRTRFEYQPKIVGGERLTERDLKAIQAQIDDEQERVQETVRRVGAEYERVIRQSRKKLDVICGTAREKLLKLRTHAHAEFALSSHGHVSHTREHRSALTNELRALGIDEHAYRFVLAETQAKLLSIHSRAPIDTSVKPEFLQSAPIPAESVVDGHKAIWRAPFLPSGSFTTGFHCGDFTVSSANNCDASSGLLGACISLSNSTAGDFDVAWYTVQSGVAFEFPVWKTGLLKLRIFAKCTDCRDTFRIEDELGWSDAWTRQSNGIIARIYDPRSTSSTQEWSYASTSDWVIEDETDGDFEAHPSTGRVVGATFLSNESYSEGSTVLVKVGTQIYNRIGTNDVSVLDAATDFRWAIQHVRVDIV